MHKYEMSELKAILKSRGKSVGTAGAKGKNAVAMLAGRLSAYLAAGEAETPDVDQKAQAVPYTKLDTSAGSPSTPPGEEAGALSPPAADKAEACGEQLCIVRRALAELPADAADSERDKLAGIVAELEQDLEYLKRAAPSKEGVTYDSQPPARGLVAHVADVQPSDISPGLACHGSPLPFPATSARRPHLDNTASSPSRYRACAAQYMVVFC